MAMSPESDPEISGPDRLTYYPLGQYVRCDDWADWAYQTDSDRWSYVVTRPVRFAFPAYIAQFRTMRGNLWRTSHLGWMDLEPGYRFDASNPAIDSQDDAVGSAVHDTCCSLGWDEAGEAGYPCGYFRAHYLYRRIDQAQGMVAVRSWYHWGALVLGNWACRIDDKPVPLPDAPEPERPMET
jgi:hypothetical protein